MTSEATFPLVRAWQLVRHTESALRQGSESLGNVPALLRAVLTEGAWREFALPTGEVVTYVRFTEFVGAPPPRGLGTDLGVIERVVGTDDPDLVLLLREAQKVGRGRRTDLEPHGDSPSSGGGNRAAYQAQRLARDHPTEYEQVRSGEKSINAAAVKAGIRPRRVSVRVDDPESIARTLLRAGADLAALRDQIDNAIGKPL